MTSIISHRWSALSWPLAVALLASAPAEALELRLGGGLSAEYSSNVQRVEDGADDLATQVWAGLSIEEQSARWRGQIAGTVTHVRYLDETEDNDTELSLAAQTEITLLPQRLYWILEDTYQQVRVDPLEAAGPDNYQDSNVFWTGPDLRFRIAKLYTLLLGARFGDFYYAESEADHQRLAALAQLQRRLSEQSTIYLSAEASEVEYEGDELVSIGVIEALPVSDYQQLDAYAGYRYTSPLTVLELDAGVSTVERETLPDLEGPLLALSVRRQLARSQAVGISLSHRYASSDTDLLSEDDFGIAADTADVEDVALVSRGQIYYTRNSGGGALEARAFYEEEDFEVSTLDRQTLGIGADYDFRYTPTWMVSVYGSYRNFDYTLLDRVDSELELGIGADHALTRRLTFGATLETNWRESDAGSDYNEWVAIVGLRYGDLD